MPFTSELVTAHNTSPDPMIPGCRNTNVEEPGVVFQAVEPMLGTHMFIGITSLTEAMAVYYNRTPDEVTALFEAPKPRAKKQTDTTAEIR